MPNVSSQTFATPEYLMKMGQPLAPQCTQRLYLGGVNGMEVVLRVYIAQTVILQPGRPRAGAVWRGGSAVEQNGESWMERI